MKKLSTYLVVMFMIMYWIFRVIVVLMAQLGKEFIVAPLNMLIVFSFFLSFFLFYFFNDKEVKIISTSPPF